MSGVWAHAIKRAVSAGAPAILSFGIAGGLSSHLIAGDWVVATGVVSGGRRIETDIEWSSRLAERLSGAELGDIVTVADPVLHPGHKRRLHVETGALAVDMESFQAAVLADELGVPFVAVRVIADPASKITPRREARPQSGRFGCPRRRDAIADLEPVSNSLVGVVSRATLLSLSERSCGAATSSALISHRYCAQP